MYLNREEGSGKGKPCVRGEHPGGLKVLLHPPLTRFHLSEVTLEVRWRSRTAVRGKCGLSLCNPSVS